MDKVDIMKKLIGLLLAVALSLTLIGCATKNDVTMYTKYADKTAEISKDTMKRFELLVTTLANSIQHATTPLERHLIREGIVELQYQAVSLVAATNGNDVAMKMLDKANGLAKTAGLTAFGIKGLDTLNGLAEASGSIEADNGSTINVDRTEEHNNVIGKDNEVIYKEDPIIVEPESLETEVVEEEL